MMDEPKNARYDAGMKQYRAAEIHDPVPLCECDDPTCIHKAEQLPRMISAASPSPLPYVWRACIVAGRKTMASNGNDIDILTRRIAREMTHSYGGVMYELSEILNSIRAEHKLFPFTADDYTAFYEGKDDGE